MFPVARFCVVLAAIAAVPTAVAASCAGLSSGAISAKFSDALESCGADAAASEPVPVVAALPHTAVIAYAAPVPHTVRGRHVRVAGGRPGDAIVRVSHQYRIDPLLLHSIVARESGFRPGAISSKGALGLMQVMPGTARSLGIRDPALLLSDPELSLATGASYLKQLQGRFGNDVPTVLAAYNAGPGAVLRYRGDVPYRETRAYVSTIMARYRSARNGQ